MNSEEKSYSGDGMRTVVSAPEEGTLRNKTRRTAVEQS